MKEPLGTLSQYIESEVPVPSPFIRPEVYPPEAYFCPCLFFFDKPSIKSTIL